MRSCTHICLIAHLATVPHPGVRAQLKKKRKERKRNREEDKKRRETEIRVRTHYYYYYYNYYYYHYHNHNYDYDLRLQPAPASGGGFAVDVHMCVYGQDTDSMDLNRGCQSPHESNSQATAPRSSACSLVNRAARIS